MSQFDVKVTEPLRGIGKTPKFTRNIIWVGGAQLFSQLLSFITLPALTKTYTTEMYGIWMQVFGTTGLISLVLSLYLGTALIRFLSANDNKMDRRRYLGSTFFTVILFSCPILAAGILFSSPFSVILFGSSVFTDFTLLTLAWAFVSALSFLFYSYLLATNKIGLYSIIQLAQTAVKMIAIITMARFNFRLEWILVGFIVIDTLVNGSLIIYISREIGFPAPNFSGLKQFLLFSIPQIPSAILLWTISTSDRYFITHFANLSETGIYASSKNMGALIALFCSPIGVVLFPAVSKAWEQNRQADVKNYFEYSTKLYLTLAIPAVAGLALYSQPLLKILTTSEYMVGWDLVTLLTIGSLFLGIYQINTNIILLVKKTKWIPLMIFIAAATNICINLVLIPHIGIIGAAISNIVSYFILVMIVSIWAHKVISYRLDINYLVKIIVASFIMAVCLYFIKIQNIMSIILAVIAGVAIYTCVLVLLRAFSTQDKRLIKETLSEFIPWVH